MNRLGLLVAALLVAASLCYGQDSSPTQSQASAAAPTPNAIGHGAFPVKLTKTWDSSKLKEGDAVEAETSGAFKLPDGTLVPKGSKLTGHVTTAKAHAKGDPESELAVAFQKLDVANGKELNIKGMVQAVFPPPDEVDPGAASGPTMARSGGAGWQPTDIKSGSNMDNGAKPQPVTDPKSTGVQGIHDLQLDKGVLSSNGKQVKLGSGVRMIVHVDIFGS